jgi:serine protease AprX
MAWMVGGAVLAAALVANASTADAASSTTVQSAGQLSASSSVLAKLLANWGDKDADSKSKSSSGKNDASLDPGSLAAITTATGARDAWATKDGSGRAVTGQGVTVAVLDSGVSTSVAGLNAAGKVVTGPDLSMEANSSTLRGKDTFGHGTFMAGIIAAKDPVATNKNTGQPQPSSDADQLGIAPDARILAVKLATTDGSTDVSQVIAGLDWVVQHKNDNGMNIRVVNLSYGTDSTQSYVTDPLAAAAENAWKHGIVVVASGGNEGTTATGLTDPATDPYVIAVGAATANNDKKAWKTPTVATFSQHGTATRHVDLLAPGTSLVSLRDVGSYIDTTYPEGQVAGDTTGRLFRGSGTSQAAAVVSGAVALLLQAYPGLTPDEVKYALTSSADSVSGSVLDRGAGELDISGALNVAKVIAATSTPLRTTLFAQNFTPATGLGSLDAARGGSYLADPTSGAALTGEVDVQNRPWNAAAWRKASVAGTAWTGGVWNGARWTGDGWTAATSTTSTTATTPTTWTSTAWSGSLWTGARWSDVSWTGARWSGARWSGARWSGAAWK